ncbi:MAG TPA: ABC transporter permease [Vicinamibacterales bacterium]|nr:ABC transporter permease [Vicinamibacterales bacterium]
MSWRRFLLRGRWDAERARELASYIELETADNIARGMTPEAARAAAHRKLGNATLVREEIYHMNTIAVLDTLWKDLRYAARLLRLNPGYTLVAVLSLTLGIGANTAIFQLLDAVRLRTLPVSHPEELVEVRIAPNQAGRTGQFSGRRPMLTSPLWEQIEQRQQALSEVFAWGATIFDLSSGGESRTAEGLWVSGGYFDALDVTPLAGRLIGHADDVRGCPAPPAVISAAFWQREYGGAAGAIGRTIRLDGILFEIAGVTPPGFFGVEVGRSFDVALPLCARPLLRSGAGDAEPRQLWWLAAFGRLKPGWTLERTTASLQSLSPGIFEETVSPEYSVKDAAGYKAFRLQALEAGTGVSTLRREYGEALTLLLSIAGLVLLIACANLANLTLARASAREREIAIRLAIGASRGRIVRQLLSESALVAALGAITGVWVARELSQLLMAFLTSDGTRWSLDLRLDWRILTFSMTLGAVTCALFGLVPALRATRTSPQAAMKSGGRGLTASRERFGLRRVLVAVQIAVSIVLLVGALLFAGTFRNLATLDPGFDTNGVLVVDVDLRPAGIAPDRQSAFQREVFARLAAVPGVAAAGRASVVPVSGSGWNERLEINGQVQQTYPNVNRVNAGYFAALGMPVLAGRNFGTRDTVTSPRVAIVSAAFAARYLPGEAPLGKTFTFVGPPGQPNPPYEIVGVVPDAKYTDLREPLGPVVFLPDTQEERPAPFLSAVLRTELAPDSLRVPVTRAATEIHPGLLLTFRTMEKAVADSLLRERLMASLSGGFAALALLLAMVGLYGLMSYTVATRRSEIGIRIALGASRGQIVRMIARETLVLVAIGSTIGLLLSVPAARAATSLLFGLTPGDPPVLTAAIGVLGFVAGASAIVPAYRAARLSPTIALRED